MSLDTLVLYPSGLHDELLVFLHLLQEGSKIQNAYSLQSLLLNAIFREEALLPDRYISENVKFLFYCHGS